MVAGAKFGSPCLSPSLLVGFFCRQIGDEDTGKNRRIEQRVLWMTEAQKKSKVVELLRGHNKDDRVRGTSVK